jgi:hypothetical protein
MAQTTAIAFVTTDGHRRAEIFAVLALVIVKVVYTWICPNSTYDNNAYKVHYLTEAHRKI